jgi:CRP/FNR family cyclic AMP-dependent transcriptional regulator
VAKSEAVELLSKVPLFSELSKRELDSIAGAGKEIRHRKGAVLAKEGASGLGFFLIVEGTAVVTVGGKPRTKMGPGDFFGEISLLDGGPRTATVTAETPMRLIGLTQWVFRRLVEHNPSIGMKMLKVMASRLRHAPAGMTQ